MKPTPKEMKANFESWWYASKYMQVIFSPEGHKQIAWDGYQAALRDIADAEEAKVSVASSTTGALRNLLAACHRLWAEAEEIETEDGLAQVALQPYWDAFIDARDEATKSLVESGAGMQPEQPKVSVPDGWKLVPIEPTPKMIDATWNEDINVVESHRRNRRIYAAMLAAAPSSKEPKP